jgi:tetratricopeptide (TPR) repeat protein
MRQALQSILSVGHLALLSFAVLQACAQPSTRPVPAPDAAPKPPTATTEAPPTPTDWRGPLLDQALRVASSPEGRSHARIKSRLQRDVAACALELGMTDRALAIAADIDDWHAGEVHALAAQRFATNGDREQARACVVRAADIADRSEGWRKERIQTEIGVALAMLGDVESARRFGGRLPQELTGRVEAQLSSQLDIDEVDRQCDAFDRAIATGSFDVVRSGVDGYFAVWERVPDDVGRRERAERSIRAALAGLPLDLQLRSRIRLADALAARGDRSAAIADLEAAERLLGDFEFTSDIRGALVRDLAAAWLRHGEAARAKPLILLAVTAYTDAPTVMIDIDRADYLRPLAEALAALGDVERARAIWTLALEAGAVNPNARPRAEDLCLTCLSMLRSGVQPSAAMTTTMRSIETGLKAPW